jgi:hypothetical protein
MENLPIDTKSLPSRIFYSEEEDKIYVGEPGDYKEVGGGDFIPNSEKAEPNGVATLGSDGKVPTSQLPSSDNPTRVIQMLPPVMGSTPRRVIIPVIDSELNQVDLIFSVNGVQFTKNTQQEINIPDASENNYRKDLIIGTEIGDVVRFEGIENEEGIIDPIQPDNTVLLTYIVVYGSSTIEEPELPIIGSQYIKKTNWIDVASSGGDVILTSVNEDLRHFVIKGYSETGGVTGLSPISFYNNPIYQGEEVIIDNDTESEIPLLHNFNNNNGAFTFPSGEDYILKPKERVIFNIKKNKISFSSSNMTTASGGGGLPPSETGKFLVGGVSDWEKRGLVGSDLGYTSGGGWRVPVWNANTNNLSTIQGNVQGNSIFVMTTPEGTVRGNPATANNELVPLGQLNTALNAYVPTSEVTSVATPNKVVQYSNTGNVNTSLAEFPENAVPLFQVNAMLESAGFVQRTGTAIAFDKWATYNSYDSPSDGNFSYDLTNAVVGMIQVSYHEDSLVPTFTQAGLNVMITGEYQPDVVNKIAFELMALDRILINIKPL